MKSVLIWAKGDRENGMGHIVRQLHLADELLSRGYQISFEIPESTPGWYSVYDWMTSRRKGYLNNPNIKHDAIIIDVEHGPNRDFLEGARRKFGKIIVFGGVGFAIHDQTAINELVDLQICQSIALNEQSVAETVIGNYLIGAEYMIIGPDYLAAREVYGGTIRGSDVLVIMGGGDPYELTPIVASKILARRNNLRFMVRAVFGPAAYMTALPHGVEYISSPKSLANLFVDARMAITGLGMTTYEAACIGVPTATISWSEDHQDTARKLERAGVSVNLGLWHDPDWDKMSEFMHRIADDNGWQKMSEAGRALVDGLGTKRVASEIEKIL